MKLADANHRVYTIRKVADPKGRFATAAGTRYSLVKVYA